MTHISFPQASSLSPLDIPEILYSIFSFLTPTQLLFGPVYVCKRWHSISFSFIAHTTSWDLKSIGLSNDAQVSFEQRLAVTDTLLCYLQDDVWVASDAIRSLKDAIASLSLKERHILRKLVVEDFGIKPRGLGFLEIFTSLRSLTSLAIETKAIWSIPIDVLLLMFPNLRVLDIGFSEPAMADASALIRAKPDQPWPTSAGKLRSLILECMTIDFLLLEDLLRVCRSLIELRLVAIQQQYPEPYKVVMYQNKQEELPAFDGGLFFTAVAAYCPILQRIQFCERHCNTSTETLQAMWSAFPNLSPWSFTERSYPYVSDPVNSIQESMLRYRTTLTCLDLESPNGSKLRRCNPIGLDQFLCVTPSLLHLKAKGVSLPMSSRLGIYRLWACRNLKTLHISLEIEDRLDLRSEMDRGNRSSRMFFAYISKCCPKLQDIYIGNSDLRLEVEGGLCLLSELEDLESLVLRTTSDHVLKDRDLCWLSALDPHQQSLREKIRPFIVVANLKQSIEDRYKDQLRLWHLHLGVRQWMAAHSTEARIWESIRKASSLEGVKMILEKRSTQQWREQRYCWSLIRTIQLESSKELEVSLIKRLRPQITL